MAQMNSSSVSFLSFANRENGDLHTGLFILFSRFFPDFSSTKCSAAVWQLTSRLWRGAQSNFSQRGNNENTAWINILAIILQQILSNRIHRLGGLGLHQLGEKLLLWSL